MHLRLPVVYTPKRWAGVKSFRHFSHYDVKLGKKVFRLARKVMRGG